ncbi:MAG: DUF3786 domain-containing protein [Oscillospiraceae bacterium]|nr:DUF3786 domain-containing protein [Oscillospiraceae bacterium]
MDNYELQVDIAKKLFLQYDQGLLTEKFGLQAEENYLYLTYLNTPCRLCRKTGAVEEYKGTLWQECRQYSTVMTVYDLLCHNKGTTLPTLANRWCTVGTFIVAGVSETEDFTRKYAAFFDGRLDALWAACEALGGVFQERMAGADLTCKFPVTAFFSVLLQFWEGDEEFSPRVLLLWDQNTMDFMHFETTFYLQGDLLGRLKDQMEGLL